MYLSPLINLRQQNLPVRFLSSKPYKIDTGRAQWREYLTKNNIQNPDEFIDKREKLLQEIQAHLIKQGIENPKLGVAYLTPKVTIEYGMTQEGFDITKALNRLPGIELLPDEIHPMFYGKFKLKYANEEWQIDVKKETYGCGFKLYNQMERDKEDPFLK